MRKASQRRGILLIGFIAIIILIWAFSGMWILLPKRYEASPHVQTADEVTIVALADLHGRSFGSNQRRLVRKVKAESPDIIVYLGDMIDRENAEKSVEAMKKLNAELVKIAPVFFVDGNHEGSVQGEKPEIYEGYRNALKEQGAVCLNDTADSLEINGTTVNLAGVTTHYYWDEKDDALVDELREKDGVNVLLCHYPESVIWYKAFEGGGLDLALCGHTHGGIVRVPFKGGVYAPEQGYWPTFDMGAFPVYEDINWYNYSSESDTEYLGTMIISSGLAGEHHVPRINNPCEITVIKVTSKGK